MPQETGKKSQQVLINIVPETFETLRRIAKAEDRPLGYVARELMIRGIRLYEADGFLKDNSSVENIIFNGLQKAIPATPPEFDLDAAIDHTTDPTRIMNDWLVFDGHEPIHDYGVIFSDGWETMSRDERAEALRDAKKVLDRSLKRKPAAVKAFRPAKDSPVRKALQKSIDDVELLTDTKPRKRRTK